MYLYRFISQIDSILSPIIQGAERAVAAMNLDRENGRVLRYYDELGLLKPAIVDRINGYREMQYPIEPMQS
jgi:hypothetical protein